MKHIFFTGFTFHLKLIAVREIAALRWQNQRLYCKLESDWEPRERGRRKRGRDRGREGRRMAFPRGCRCLRCLYVPTDGDTAILPTGAAGFTCFPSPGSLHSGPTGPAEGRRVIGTPHSPREKINAGPQVRDPHRRDSHAGRRSGRQDEDRRMVGTFVSGSWAGGDKWRFQVAVSEFGVDDEIS